MSLATSIRFADEAGPGPEVPSAPKVFSRVVTVPAGMPWDQARGARLEARHGAPLDLSLLRYRLKRVEPWSPGRPARFAVFYVLASEASGQASATLNIDGKMIEVKFASAVERASRFKLAAVGAVGAAVALGLLAFGVTAALEQRAATSQKLDSLEQRSAMLLRRESVARRARSQSAALAAATRDQTPLSAVVAELSWAAGARAPEARLDAIHWRSGVLAVEVRGAGEPFRNAAGRKIERSPKPLRPGVWLWGASRNDEPSRATGKARDGGW